MKTLKNIKFDPKLTREAKGKVMVFTMNNYKSEYFDAAQAILSSDQKLRSIVASIAGNRIAVATTAEPGAVDLVDDWIGQAIKTHQTFVDDNKTREKQESDAIEQAMSRFLKSQGLMD